LPSATPPLGARGLSKRFGAVTVLREVSLEFAAGEVHAVIGENGAGKSTLMKLLAGLQEPSGGEVLLDGRPVCWRGPGEAELHGIVMIHQELNLAPDLSVEANLFLGRERRRGLLLDRARMRREAQVALARLEAYKIDPGTPVRELSIAQQQLVEIAKALAKEARVLILDEPTAVLDEAEAETLMARLRVLRERGVALVYISHRLDEVKRLADRVSVLRDGAWVTTRPAAELTTADMAALMVGRPLGDLFPPRPPAPSAQVPPLLEARGVTVPGQVEDVSLVVRPGEIFGFAGLVGSGRTELWEGVLGLRAGRTGEVRVGGAVLPPDRYRLAVEEFGCVLLAEDRKVRGLHLGRPVRENVVMMALRQLAGMWLNRKRELAVYRRRAEQLQVRAPGPEATPRELSGGNQQKIALARVLETRPRLVVLDEPTRGVDIGTKAQIYRLIADLAAQGLACVVISSELTELLGLCHRIAVLREGRLAAVFEGPEATEYAVMHAATHAVHRSSEEAVPDSDLPAAEGSTR
jgi:ribose transport system ATP-binding protein